MKEISPAVHPECREFVAVVETLLERRRQELTLAVPGSPWDDSDWGVRAWTRTELEDMIYSSYKPMRQGRVTRPPRREIVMEIADYLDCTLEERNQLLVAAGTTPVTPYLTGEKLAEVLEVAISVASALPLPAIIINRDWRVHYINPHILTLNGVTPEQIAAIPAPALNILHLLFDPALPLYGHLIQNRASWTRMVRQTIYGFKLANLLCQREPWYRALLEQLSTLPEFDYHWRTVSVETAFDADIVAHAQAASVVLEVAVLGHAARALLRPSQWGISSSISRRSSPFSLPMRPATSCSG
jgi:PAS domain-containing protein